MRHRNIKILSFIVVFVWTTSCSQKLYPDGKKAGKNENIKTGYDSYSRPSDNKELKTFFGGGVEKSVASKGIKSSEIIKTALSFLGVPHCMGGSTKKCTDCSGFVIAVFAEHGVTLPHNSEEQARYGKIIREKEKLTEGDLVFFIESYNTKRYITHSGIYMGNNQFIHTSSSKGVTITSLDNSWWKDKFVFGTRILEN